MKASNRVITPSGSLADKPFHSRLTNFVVSTNKQFAATTSTNAFDDFSELITIDIQNSKANPNQKIPLKDCKMLAISPSGKTVATFKDGWGSAPGRVDFWRTEDGNLRQTASWKTAGFHDRDGFAPKQGFFVDETRLLTIGKRVALWDCETAASLYSFQVSNTTPAFSPNKKQVAVASQDSVYLISVNDGKVLGTIDDAGASLGGLAFSQNGRFLAGYSRQNGAIRIWDLNDGELIQQMAAPGGSASSIQWVGNRYLLISNNALMDVELRATVWNYNMMNGKVFSAGDGRFWIVTKTKLVPVKLPHKKLTKLTGNLDPEELLVLKPGVSVGLELNLPFRPNEQKEIRDTLTAQLEGAGVTIGNSADYQLKLTVKKGKRQTTEMSGFHDPFGRRGTQKISFTPNTCHIALTRGDAVLWQKSATYSAGGIIHLNEGESAQAAATRLCQPKPGFFTNVKIPPFIAVLPGNKPLGVSSITNAGLQ